MVPSKDEKTINAEPTKSAYAARAAAIDCRGRSNEALANNAFFRDPAHVAKLARTDAVLRDFFGTSIVEHYVNHRENRGKPFTTIKIKLSTFPRASAARKTAQYDAPLADLGVERITSKRTNSLLYRVR
jgi:hypothetical protein